MNYNTNNTRRARFWLILLMVVVILAGIVYRIAYAANRAEAEESNRLSVMGAGDSSVRSVVDDLQMEMQMERAETKKKHRRNTLLLRADTRLY